MDWKKLFSNKILKRGKDYYNRNLVTDFNIDGNTITAEVIGSEPYKVTIKNPCENSMAMTCTCPYGGTGFNCKHMAAVMYEWDLQTGKVEDDSATASRNGKSGTNAQNGAAAISGNGANNSTDARIGNSSKDAKSRNGAKSGLNANNANNNGAAKRSLACV